MKNMDSIKHYDWGKALLSKGFLKMALMACLLPIIFFWTPSFTLVADAATASRKYGDVNGNGQIDSGDSLLLQRHIAAESNASTRTEHPDWILSDYDFKAGDINKNNKIDMGDVISILRHTAAQNDNSVRSKHPNWILSSTFSCSYPNNGFYVIVSALNNNKVVDLNGGSTNNGTNIQLWTANNTYAQVFHLVRNGQYFSIRNIATNKAVDVAGGSRNKGTNVQQYQYSANNNAQLWKFESAGNGYYYIRSKLGHYLDVSNGNTSDGTNILVWELHKGNNQKFKIVNVEKREPMYVQANLHLRASNTTSSTSMAVMTKGSLVYRYCTAGDWSLISYNGKKGYASTKYLGKNKPSNNPSASNGISYAAYTGIDYTKQTNDSRRINALRKAQRMVTVKWVCPESFVTWSSKGGSYNKVTDASGGSSTKFVKGKTYVGIPYSMINHSYDENAWINLVNNGFKTKDMEGTYLKYPKKGTAKGVDCSYFVYLSLKAGGADIKYQNTSSMLNSTYYTKISKDKLKPGDILLKNGHVMLFVGKSGNNFAVFEATASGSKTRYKVYTSSDISAYTAYKYKKW